MVRIAALVIACVISTVCSAHGADARDARLVWSSFQCATYAEYSGDQTERERLFTLGVATARTLIDAIRNHEIADADLQREAPIGLLLSLGGPSTDFMVGVIFAHVSDDAFDEINRETGNSSDRDLRHVVASNLFQHHNCTLIR